MKLVPLTDRVVLKQLEAEETTASGIVLPGACTVGGSINHKHLQETCAKVLGLQEFDEAVFLERVDVIYVPKRETLEFHLKDGTVVTEACKNTGHQDCWTEERRAATSLKRKNGKRLVTGRRPLRIWNGISRFPVIPLHWFIFQRWTRRR